MTMSPSDSGNASKTQEMKSTTMNQVGSTETFAAANSIDANVAESVANANSDSSSNNEDKPGLNPLKSGSKSTALVKPATDTEPSNTGLQDETSAHEVAKLVATSKEEVSHGNSSVYENSSRPASSSPSSSEQVKQSSRDSFTSKLKGYLQGNSIKLTSEERVVSGTTEPETHIITTNTVDRSNVGNDRATKREEGTTTTTLGTENTTDSLSKQHEATTVSNQTPPRTDQDKKLDLKQEEDSTIPAGKQLIEGATKDCMEPELTAQNDSNASNDALLQVKSENSHSQTTAASEVVNDDISLLITSSFLKRYWRNDRKNLQCFPVCPEFGDYFTCRLNGFEHRPRKGACREPINLVLKLKSAKFDIKQLTVVGRFIVCRTSKSDEPSADGSITLMSDSQAKTMKQGITRTQLEALKAEGYVARHDFESTVRGTPATTDTGSSTMEVESKGEIKEEDSSPNKTVDAMFSFHAESWRIDVPLSKRRHNSNKPLSGGVQLYCFEVLVFSETLNPLTDPSKEGRYELILSGKSPLFEIANTRTLVRRLSVLKGTAAQATATPVESRNDVVESIMATAGSAPSGHPATIQQMNQQFAANPFVAGYPPAYQYFNSYYPAPPAAAEHQSAQHLHQVLAQQMQPQHQGMQQQPNSFQMHQQIAAQQFQHQMIVSHQLQQQHMQQQMAQQHLMQQHLQQQNPQLQHQQNLQLRHHQQSHHEQQQANHSQHQQFNQHLQQQQQQYSQATQQLQQQQQPHSQDTQQLQQAPQAAQQLQQPQQGAQQVQQPPQATQQLQQPQQGAQQVQQGAQQPPQAAQQVQQPPQQTAQQLQYHQQANQQLHFHQQANLQFQQLHQQQLATQQLLQQQHQANQQMQHPTIPAVVPHSNAGGNGVMETAQLTGLSVGRRPEKRKRELSTTQHNTSFVAQGQDTAASQWPLAGNEKKLDQRKDTPEQQVNSNKNPAEAFQPVMSTTIPYMPPPGGWTYPSFAGMQPGMAFPRPVSTTFNTQVTQQMPPQVPPKE